ncbi:MAG TPA: phosphoglycerate dehydrogenase [Solirubrobacteraceae bacterium]|jgi:D-3-phosphoglycerate dehydrogenase|nr:phosphoglycerate dehydrogenase [Solirubrobacteraceae bacterium]
MSGERVLITCRQMQNCIDEFLPRLNEHELELVLPEVVQQPSEDDLIEIIGDFDGMIAGDDPLSARVLDYAKRMRIIAKWGVGIDGIDLDAARVLGIPVVNTPGVFGGEVADLALGYVIMLARQLHRIDASVKAGGWFKHEGRSLAGKVLGVAGFGSIGQAVGTRGQGFGMRVVAHDVADAASATAANMGVEMLDRNELFQQSDFLVLCSPLTPETRHMVNQCTLDLMQPGSYLVNVGRGPLVDEIALIQALDSGQVAAAGLDVFEEEPLPATSGLRRFDQCVFGSHNASNTREGVLRTSARAVENLINGLGYA